MTKWMGWGSHEGVLGVRGRKISLVGSERGIAGNFHDSCGGGN